jgi:phage terminase large subunit-like protein
MGGKPVILELWEKALLATIFGFIDIEGNRKYREAILIVGKKNGKSLISSCVGLYLQVGDGEAGPEVYAVATKRDQAKIIWSEAKRMVRKSPSLLKRIKPLVSELNSELFNDGIFKPLASDSDTLDGLNIHGCLMDEFHQWKNGRPLYNIMADGGSARDQPLNFMTSTAGTIREDIYDEKYDEVEMLINGYFDENGYKDDRLIAFVYELDNRNEWTDPNCHKKANPGLGTIKNAKTLADKVAKAILNSNLVKNLVCKEFNIRETSVEAWLPFETILNKEMFDVLELKPKYGIGGTDLSSTTDLTAAKFLFMVPNDKRVYVMSMYWLPEVLLEKRSKEDKIPYDTWRDMGLLRTCEGNSVHPKVVTEWFLEIRDKYGIYMPWCGYDGWSAEYWVEEMKGHFGEECMKKIIQGAKTLSAPMKKLGADLESKLVIYNNNPIDKWCISNTKIDVDSNDNIKPIKTSHQRRRIDGLSALLDAYVVLQDKMQEYQNII